MPSLINSFLVAKGRDWSGSTLKHKPIQEEEVTESKSRMCRHLVAGKNATNLKSHLEVHHSEQFKEFKEKEQEKKTSLKQK